MPTKFEPSFWPYTAASIFPFKEAPVELRALSTNGGDEDFLAILPPYQHDRHPYIDSPGFSACCNVQKILLDNGWLICIGSHA